MSSWTGATTRAVTMCGRGTIDAWLYKGSVERIGRLTFTTIMIV